MSIALILAITGLVSGCSFSDAEERQYEIPDALCGIEIDKNLWDPLFPIGEKIRVDGYGEGELAVSSPFRSCNIWIDDKPAINLDTLALQREGGVVEYIRSQRPGSELGELDVSESDMVQGGDYEIRVWSHAAIAYADCESEEGNVGMAVSVWVADGADHRDDLSQVILPYADARADQIAPRSCDATDAYS